MNELQRIKEAYSQRFKQNLSTLYTLWQPYMYMSRQEKERNIYKLFNKANITSLSDLTLLEIGCGEGHKILDLLQMGFSPKNITGNELMTEHLEAAKYLLPASISLLSGDARELDIKKESKDIIYQSMVFSSILDNDFQNELAKKMWQWVKPGGGILWYDFTFNNPRNKNVKGIPLSRVKALFPGAKISTKRITLAPPLSRRVTKLYPSFYTLFNYFPFLRTHILCYIQKPAS